MRGRGCKLKAVMRGFAGSTSLRCQDVDGRVKPGHDDIHPGSRHARPGMTAEYYNPSTIFATISRWISDEPPKMV